MFLCIYFAPNKTTKKNNHTMKKHLIFILNLINLTWISLRYKPVFVHETKTDENLDMKFYFRGRWYSPLYWAVKLAWLPVSLFTVGLMGWFDEIVYQLADGSYVKSGYEATFTSPPTEKQWLRMRWYIIYSNFCI